MLHYFNLPCVQSCMARRAQQCMASSMLPQEKSERADNRFYSTSRNQVLANAVHCARGCFAAAARKGLWSEHFFNHLLLNQYISARAAQSRDTDSRLAV